MQSVTGQDVGGKGVDQRLQCRCGGTHPAAQGRGLQAHPVSREDLGLAIERQVIVVFRHDDMGKQPCSGAAAGDRVVGRRRRHYGVANPARQLLANVPDDFEAARHVIESLADLIGDFAQRAAAARTSARCGMAPIFSRQMFRQGAPRRLLRFGRGLDGCSDLRRCRYQPLRLVGLQRLQRQLELLSLARQLLRGLSELGPSISRQLEFQAGDLSLRGQRILHHRGNDPLQRGEVVGQSVGGDRHAGSGSDLPPFWSMVRSSCPSRRCPAQPASSGRQVRCGIRQSIPSSSIDNCARLSTATPSSARGQTNRPRSRRLANRHSPSPSHHNSLTRSPRRPRKQNT